MPLYRTHLNRTVRRSSLVVLIAATGVAIAVGGSESSRTELPTPAAEIQAVTPVQEGAPCHAHAAHDADANALLIAQMVYPELYERLSPELQVVLANRVEIMLDPNRQPHELLPQLCFAPGTADDIVELFSLGAGFDGRYYQNSRWSTTASGSTGGQGDPITLTYSFPPDGTTIPASAGFSSGTNNLNAWMATIYGANPATWKAHFTSVFNRWSQLAGLTYIHETNDDGANMHQNSGVLGVRGDLRIGAKNLGSSGVLAYNQFPNDGDMVLNSNDNFFNNTGSNSLRLRNVIAHEHGHGLGMLHVCPINETKLMEPFVSTAYDGPRHDDVRNANRHYGDPYEPNNSAATATSLGTFNVPGSTSLGTPPLPTMPNGSNLSLDATSESDFFSLQVNAPAVLNVNVTPIGTSYGDSQQACPGSSGSCCNNNTTDSLSIANLNIQVFGNNGGTLLATGASAPAGSAEILNGVNLVTPGVYHIRVYAAGSFSQSQMYRISITLNTFTPLSITLPAGAPTLLTPGQPEEFPVVVNPGSESLVAGSAKLNYRYDGGSFIAVDLTPVGGNNYTATLPAPECEDSAEFYISATGSATGAATNPSGGASSPYSAEVSDEGCQQPPAAPTNVVATNGAFCDKVTITWDGVVDAADYTIWRSTVNDTGSAGFLAEEIVGTTYDDTTAPQGQTLFYWVTACNGAGCSSFSTEDSGSTDVPPAAPTGLAATQDTVCGAVDLEWNASAGASTYTVWRSEVDDFGTAASIDTTAATNLRDSSADPDLSYFYWVTADGTCGESVESVSVVGSAAPKGDFNLDGFINGADLQGFVDAMLGDTSGFDCADLAPPFGTLDENDTTAIIAILIAL